MCAKPKSSGLVILAYPSAKDALSRGHPRTPPESRGSQSVRCLRKIQVGRGAEFGKREAGFGSEIDAKFNFQCPRIMSTHRTMKGVLGAHVAKNRDFEKFHAQSLGDRPTTPFWVL